MYFHFDILLILGFNSDANSILRLLHHVGGGDVARILEVPAPPFSGVKCVKWECCRVYTGSCFQKTNWEGGRRLVHHLGQQGQGTVKNV